MSLETLTKTVEEKLRFAPPLNARVKFQLGDDGVILVDGTQKPAVISHEDEEADTVLSCSVATFEAILNGTQDPNMAFMMGKLKVKGSMGLALKLSAILED